MTFMGQHLKPRTSVEYIMMSSFHMVPMIQVMGDHDLLVLKQPWRFGVHQFQNPQYISIKNDPKLRKPRTDGGVSQNLGKLADWVDN